MAKASGRAARFGVGLAVGAASALAVVDLGLASAVSLWGDPSWVVPACALLFGAAWCGPLRGLVAGFAALLAVLWLAVAYTPLTSRLAAPLVRRDAGGTADAAFVFASAIQDDGEPTAASMSRLLRGIELVADGRTSRLVVSECAGCAPYAPVARAWSRLFAGAPEVDALGPISNTHDEAVAVAKLARERGWRRVLAVTSPVHTRRACAALEQAGLEVLCVPSIETRYDVESLRDARDRRAAFAPILHEWIGNAVYRRRGWVR